MRHYFIRLVKRILRIVLTTCCLGILLTTFYFNIKIHPHTDFKIFDNAPINTSVVHQLKHLQHAIYEGAATDMQRVYPEGYIFMHALYGLTWYDLASSHPSSTLRSKAIRQLKNAHLAINSGLGKMPFQEDLAIGHGAFYSGWCNYVLGKILMLQKSTERDSSMVTQFKLACTEIATVIDAETFPESYAGMRWPADAIVAAACLSVHDKIFTPTYQKNISDLITRLRKKVDGNGLVPHRCDEEGNVIESARGSSQSLILNFLLEIDSTFAHEQFDLYREKFLDNHFGLYFIREYPKGQTGDGDIDSGPVVWDIGSAGTIVGLRTLMKFGNTAESDCISHCIEAFGFPTESENGKHYLLGQLVMADAFIAWSKSSENALQDNSTANRWRWKFHGYSAFLVAMLICGIVLCWRIKI